MPAPRGRPGLPMPPRTYNTSALLGILLASVPGCTTAGAPDIEVAGSYFPGWLICGLIGIAGGVLARVVFVATHVAEMVPYQLTVCTGLGLIVAIGTWLLFFR